jgi:hypothetical protein
VDSAKLSHWASVLFEAATIAIAVVIVVQWLRGDFGETL